MINDPRNDPAQQPRDPSTNPNGEQPIKDPVQNPKDPCTLANPNKNLH